MRNAFNNYKGSIIRAFFTFTLISFILAGCSTVTPQPKGPSASASVSGLSTPPKPLRQVREALDNGNFTQAERLLEALERNSLNTIEQIEYDLLATELHINLHETELAEFYLSEVKNQITQANHGQQLAYGQLEALLLEANGQYFQAARQRILQASELSKGAYSFNHEMIWYDLMHSNEEALTLEQGELKTVLAQWQALALISRDVRLTLDEQLKAVRIWQQRYPHHPASLNLPEALKQLAEAINSRPKHVALLLPLSGPLAKTGQAIRDGFLASYYESLIKGYEVPEVSIYDSLRLEDINAAYAQAQFDGAQWLIGPLEKPQVQSLTERASLPLPTLALNYGERHQHEVPENLYQFGLAAEDEAQQIAEQAWADGKRHALVLAPQGAWGKRVVEAFEERWLALGGTLGGEHFYPKRQDYNPDVRALLKVTESQQRYRTIRQLTRQATQFEPRRREDADWLFLLALPQQARQIKPTLAFNFAADIAVYSTSHVYSGTPNPSIDRDLNGIKFCDTPWLLQDSVLYQEVEQAVKGQGHYARLYAMGVDTFRLLPYLPKLKASPKTQLFGSTGALRLDSQQRVVRRTECTVFVGGKPL